jgi:Virus neck protein
MEQTLIEDLIIESIRVYGVDLWYIPRTLGAVDDALNEDDLPIFNKAFMIEMYIKNVDGFGGDGQFLSKFGLQIRDSITFSVAMRRFSEDISFYNEEIRPKEGDLLYFPLNGKIFEVMFVDNKPIFYQMGALQMYDLRCELFEYSNEVFNTGVEEVDAVLLKYKTTANNTIAGIESIDPLADNLTFETIADGVLDFSEDNPFGEDNY